ncbi:MAG: N-6 DNA methylase, partial [Armatimonadetes bacterium]|nr:N-6 DNA methylase [Armatimonadota bacterium]
YPDSPYEFSVLPADILGQVYEQFLGKVIRLTAGHRATVEDKPEVKKAGGVYYTPTYIVDYIVEHTVGKLLDGKTPKQASKLRILDPACGSGSFLIGAYQYLLDWHRDWYVADGPEKHRKSLYQGPGGDWRLTTAERKKILLNNIYGVDIDSQAVEVTKLSLLLKVLEQESAEAMNRTLKMFHERALPDLGSNIKCGNSLIGPDFYDNQQMSFLDEDEQYRINVFDWNAGFPEVMKSGGFDAVIGNPPYIFGEYHDGDAKQYFARKFQLARGQYDTYWLFVEQGIRLMSKHGFFSLIVPDALLARDESRDTRDLLLEHGLERIYHCGPVFLASVSAVVFVVSKDGCGDAVICDRQGDAGAVADIVCTRTRFERDRQRRLLIHATDQEADILQKIEDVTIKLKELVSISRGEETGKKHVLPQGTVAILVGDDISRYAIKKPTRFVDRVYKASDLYRSPKIVIVKTGSQCVGTLDYTGMVTMQSVYNLVSHEPTTSLEAILGILNGKLVRFIINKTCTAYKLLFPQLNQSTLESIPIPNGLEERKAPLVGLVERMLSLQIQLTETKSPPEKESLQGRIDATNREIDRLVYELYGLTEEEIGIVEGEAGADYKVDTT